MQKNEDLKSYLDLSVCDVFDLPQTGNTNTRVRFGGDVCEFLSRWCEAGPTHHLALGVGHHIHTLRKFARISGIELIEVR